MHIWKINPISTCYIISEDVWYCTSFNGSTGQWTKAKWHGLWVRWAHQFTSRELSRVLCIFRPRNHGFFGAYSLFARNPVCAVIVIICQKIPVWKVPKFAFCRVYSFDGLCVCPQNSRTIWHIFTTFYLQMYFGLVHKRTGPKGHVFGGKPRINIWLNTHASHYSFWSYYRQHTSAS